MASSLSPDLLVGIATCLDYRSIARLEAVCRSLQTALAFHLPPQTVPQPAAAAAPFRFSSTQLAANTVRQLVWRFAFDAFTGRQRYSSGNQRQLFFDSNGNLVDFKLCFKSMLRAHSMYNIHLIC